MSNPQDPYGGPLPPYTYDPLGRPPPPPPPPVFHPPPPPPSPPPRPSVNPFATLSVVFAFVFPPVGAILGHLGLAQIRRTGELGRDRAVVGLVLSYALVASTVVALAAWVAFAALAPTPSRTAAPAPTTTPAPAPPAVAPATVATLLPGLDALESMTADQNLEAGQTWDRPSRSDREGTIDRAECWGSIAPGTPDAYTAGILGYHAQEFSDTRTLLKSVQVIQAAAAFRDPPTAQSQLDGVLAGWRQCGGTTVRVTIPGTGPIPFALSAPADGGNGISTLDLAPAGLQIRSTRAIAAKANVVVDLYVSCSGTTDGDRPRQAAVSIANYVLNKIPG
ncbi:sensor domain-containing protein [Mycobacterium sp. 050134]|uniref:sensor domain-containing protein n=1 Tax=Mycobacterium sp. 050134 TaxID=3096111 RepID=UPI002EDB56FE